jgi:hypothetical protein
LCRGGVEWILKINTAQIEFKVAALARNKNATF